LGNSRVRPSFSLNLDSDIAGLRKKRNQINPLLMKSGMGSWEVHTKGIGAKLLLQVYTFVFTRVCVHTIHTYMHTHARIFQQNGTMKWNHER